MAQLVGPVPVLQDAFAQAVAERKMNWNKGVNPRHGTVQSPSRESVDRWIELCSSGVAFVSSEEVEGPAL
jgi:hypothetical protein